MATFTKPNKNNTTFKKPSKGHDTTWDKSKGTWDTAQGTWDTILTIFTKKSKNITSFNNKTKN